MDEVRRSIPALVLRVLAGALVAAALAATAADPDLWGHVRFGQDILSRFSIPRYDGYAFPAGRAWVNHEWLAEVLFGLTFMGAGGVGLVMLRFALLLIAGVTVYRALRAEGVHADGRVAGVFALALAVAPRVQAIRPQLFSALLFAVLLSALLALERGSRRAAIVPPLALMIWANLHGGFIVGLVTTWCWALLPGDATNQRPRTSLRLLLAIASLTATLVNPYGVGLWRFIRDTVTLNRPDIQDWLPITQVPLSVSLPWYCVVVLALLASRYIWRPPAWRLALVVALMLGSARVSRLDVFFALAVVLLLAEGWNALVPELASLAAHAPPAAHAMGVRAIAAVATAFVVIAGALLLGPTLGCVQITGDWPPEAEAGQLLASRTLQGRMLTWFDWGEYAIWYGAPAVSVSMDGRRETVYAAADIDDQMAFYRGAAPQLPDRIGADFAWLPVRAAAIAQLEATGWQHVFDGSRSVVLARGGHAVSWTASRVPVGRRCFPGP